MSGEISSDYIENKFKKLIQSDQKEDRLEAIFIKIEYMINMEKYQDYFNDFLYKLCYKKYVFIRGEHHYFKNNLVIVFEIASYPNNFLFDYIPFLKHIPKTECKFKINEFEFSPKIYSDEQIVGQSLKHILLDHSRKFLDYAKIVKPDDRHYNFQEIIKNSNLFYQLNR